MRTVPTDPGRALDLTTGPAASAQTPTGAGSHPKTMEQHSPTTGGDVKIVKTWHTSEPERSHPNGWLYLAAGLAVVASIALILAAYLT